MTLQTLVEPVSRPQRYWRRVHGWKDIASAPRDGRRVIVMYADGMAKTDVFHDGQWQDKISYCPEYRTIGEGRHRRDVILQPTHWFGCPLLRRLRLAAYKASPRAGNWLSRHLLIQESKLSSG